MPTTEPTIDHPSPGGPAPGPDERSRAALARRALADVLDTLLALLATAVGVLGWVVVMIVTSVGESSAPTLGMLGAGALAVLGVLAALVVLVGGDLRGTSPGRRLAGVRLIAADGNAPVWWRGLARGAVRTLALVLLLLDTTLGLLLLAVLLGPALLGADGRGLHDRLLATRVVRRSTDDAEVQG